jgi:putative hemolysin
MSIKKIPKEKLNKLYDALRAMGREYVKKPYKHSWTPERPSTGYCYVVAEVVYHYCAPKGSHTYRMETDEGSHWFVKTPNGEIIDPTADQFDKPLDYRKAEKYALIPVSNEKMSKAARKLAKLLGLPELREIKKSEP